MSTRLKPIVLGSVALLSLGMMSMQNAWSAASASLASNAQHTCTLGIGGVVRCVGTNLSGQLGIGSSEEGTPFFLAAASGIVNARAVSAGLGFSCAILVDQSVKCWGRNVLGQLGNGNTIGNLQPGDVVLNVTGARALSSGQAHSCAIVADGAVRCWGNNSSGQLGNGSTGFATAPTPVTGLRGAVAVSAGVDSTCVLLDTGVVRCWGSNLFGQLGLQLPGGATRSLLPVEVPDVRNASAISVGTAHACAVVDGGQVQCWGNNAAGQVSGLGETSAIAAVRRIPNLSDALAVAAGTDHSCARTSRGRVACWGNNRFGQLGTGQRGSESGTRAIADVPTLSQVIGLSSGGHFNCAERTGGELLCWGGNAAGQLRTTDTIDQLSPRTMQGITVLEGELLAGTFFNPGRTGEGIVLDYGLSSGQPSVVLAWYSYDALGRPVYLIGSSPFLNTNGELTVPVFRTRGARFGSSFRPEDVSRIAWGSVSLRFNGCDAIAGSWSSTDPSFSAGGPIRMQRLGQRPPEQPCNYNASLFLAGANVAKSTTSVPDLRFSGTWFDPQRSGEGVQLSFFLSNRTPTVFVAWYTYDNSGSPVFITGSAPVTSGDIQVPLILTSGPRFGPDYLASALQIQSWGSATLSFNGCNQLRLNYSSTLATFGSGLRTMQRLLQPISDTCQP